MDALKKQRAVKKGKFTRKERLLHEAIIGKKPLEVIELLWTEVCCSFEEVQQVNEGLQCMADLEEDINECNEYIGDIEKIKNELFERVVKRRGKKDL